MKEILGIDIGGSGMKGAPVNTKTGEMLKERHRIETPQPATPETMAKVLNELCEYFKWKGPVGIGFPAAVQSGIVKTASNIDKSWIGVNAEEYFSKATKNSCFVVNDADAAGYAEMKFGAGKGVKGLVMLITIGTGIGTVMFSQKKLVPNLEWGHILLPNGKEAEAYCSDKVRKDEGLDWDTWGKRFNEYLVYMEQLCYPELIIIGGGVSKKMENFTKHLTIKTPVVPAKLLNDAGLIGAALAAKKMTKE